MRKLAVFLAFLLATAFSHAALHEPSIDVFFPDQLAGLQFAGRKDFPQKELGASYAYERGFLRGSVYIYTGGLRSIPDGTDSEKVRRHFAQVIDEVRQLGAMGQVRSVTVPDGPPRTTAWEGCGPQFLWKEFEMSLSEELHLVSYTFLTAVRDNFVKVRISYKKGSANGKEDVDRFISELRKVIGKCQGT